MPDAHCREPDGRSRRARARAQRLHRDDSAVRPGGRAHARIGGAARAAGGRSCPLDGAGGHAQHQRRPCAGRIARGGARAADHRRPRAARSGHGAAFSRPGERERGRRRRRAGAARARAEGPPADAPDRAEVQRRALLRLQSLRVSLAARPRDGPDLDAGGSPAQEAHPRDRARRLGRDAPLRARPAERREAPCGGYRRRRASTPAS